MTTKMASADHKKIITTMLDKVYQDFQKLRADEARDFVKAFGATAWLDLLKPKRWKRLNKSTLKSNGVTYVARTFAADSPNGAVHMRVTEEIELGETLPKTTKLAFEFYPIQLKPIIDWANGATATITKDDKGLTVGKTNLRSEESIAGFAKAPGESMLDTPKPEGFGAFG